MRGKLERKKSEHISEKIKCKCRYKTSLQLIFGSYIIIIIIIKSKESGTLRKKTLDFQNVHRTNMIITTNHALLLCYCFLSVAVASVSAVPLPGGKAHSVKFDQRQEGDWNVRADLENFVILIVPTTSGSTPSATLGLLDLLTKAVPFRKNNFKGNKKPPPQQQQEEHVIENTESFIESKTAPYHVDISKSRDNLAKLHPVVFETSVPIEEILASKNLELKNERKGRNLHVARGFVLTKPLQVDEDANEPKVFGRKAVKKEPVKKLSLLGAEHEDCGPGYARDNKGVCRFVKKV